MNQKNQSPEAVIQDGLERGKEKAKACIGELKSQIASQPLKAAGVAVGIGYIARSLPVLAVTASTAKAGLRILPSAIFALGAWKAWSMLQRARTEEDQGPPRWKSKPDPGLTAHAPGQAAGFGTAP